MKVYAISDLHLSTSVDKPMNVFGTSWDNYFDVIRKDWLEKVASDDVVLLCGDFSWAMRAPEAVSDFAIVKDLPGKKIIIRGNHDYWWNTITQVRDMLPEGFFAIQNDSLRIGNYIFFGTRGWTCPDVEKPLSPQDKKLYDREIERLKLSIAHMQNNRRPDDVAICLMHFPPFNYRYECSDFVSLLVAADVKKVVYGHLHGKDCRALPLLTKYGIDFYLTSCDIIRNTLVRIE